MVSAPSKLSYFNPVSSEHHAYEDSKKLSGGKKAIIWVASVIAGLVGLGFGGVATFRTLVGRCSVGAVSQTKVTASGIENVSRQGLIKTENLDILKQGAKKDAKRLAMELKKSLAAIDNLKTSEKRTFNNMMIALDAYSESGDIFESIGIHNNKGDYEVSASGSIFGSVTDPKLSFQKKILKFEQSKKKSETALAVVGREIIIFSSKVFQLATEGEVIEDVV